MRHLPLRQYRIRLGLTLYKQTDIASVVSEAKQKILAETSKMHTSYGMKDSIVKPNFRSSQFFEYSVEFFLADLGVYLRIT